MTVTAAESGATGAGGAEAPGGPLLLGVRHHGPGSARAVLGALEAYRPRVLLVEGPPEADAVVALAGDDSMRPPVALVAHAPDEPGRAAFWPFAEFSPEWAAIRWALRRGVPVRFIDLPAAHGLAARTEDRDGGGGSGDGAGRSGDDRAGPGAGPGGPVVPDGGDGHGTEEGGGSGGARGGEGVSGREGRDEDARDEDPPGEEGDTGGAGPGGGSVRPCEDVRADPLAVLAETAGHDDPERWWEDVVEHRDAREVSDPYAPFAAVGEAMAALREQRAEQHAEWRSRQHGEEAPATTALARVQSDEVREAHMRLRLREAAKEFGAGGVAVVCGAWHVPALAAGARVTDDRRLVRGLPRVKTAVTWVPWTYRRLARRTGYGAGISSPGWYGHLFSSPDRVVERWMTKAAGLLREEEYAVSSAHVIEAVRLAEALAAMRGRPLAGLGETLDAVRAVMCEGSDVPLALVRDRLVVGNVLGEVPAEAPAVPLQRDLARRQRTLRLKPEAGERELHLDLRKDTDSARSRLLHRLRLLEIDWGRPARSRTGSTGTFRESWLLRWEPELSVRTAEAGVWGTTVEAAATAKAASLAREATGLSEVTALAERCLLAELPEALTVVMRALADRAALDSDVGRLAEALPALVRSVRYGNVRRTDAAALAGVAHGLAERICVGLPPACTGLDADGAERMRGHLDAVHGSVALLAQATETERDGTGGDGPAGATNGPTEEAGEKTGEARAGDGRPRAAAAAAAPHASRDVRSRWRGVLHRLARRDRIPGLIRGRCVRLLLDDAQLTQAEAARLMSLALSPAAHPPEAAAWIEGFLAGGGMLLVHDERLLGLVDGWLSSVPAESFANILPLLRRTFAEFEPGVRRTVGELVRRDGRFAAGEATPVPWDGGAGAGGLAGRPPLRPVRGGFGHGLDAARADAVLPTLRLLLRGPGPGAAADGSPAARPPAAAASAGAAAVEAATPAHGPSIPSADREGAGRRPHHAGPELARDAREPAAPDQEEAPA